MSQGDAGVGQRVATPTFKAASTQSGAASSTHPLHAVHTRSTPGNTAPFPFPTAAWLALGAVLLLCGCVAIGNWVWRAGVAHGKYSAVSNASTQ
jgi:hypothetical protein